MHHHHHTTTTSTVSPEAEKAMRCVTIAAVIVASFLVLAKTYGWAVTNSLSLLSSLVDSLFDVVVSLINMFAVRYALKPADDDHRFGHTSIEDIAGLAQFAFICGSMLFIIAQSIQRIVHPVPVEQTDVGIVIMLLSIVLTALLLLAQRRVYRQTGSLIIHADSLHYLTDLLMNLSIIASLLLVGSLGFMWIDAVLAIGIAVYILVHASHIGRRAFDNLMDKEMPDEEKEAIIAIIDKQSGVKGYHALKTRYSGMKPFIQMHLELDGKHSLHETHEIADALEHALEEAFPGAEVIVHQDPV